MIKQNQASKKVHRICVLGNFSGRNAGDMAILGCLMHDVASHYQSVQFVVPTINPNFVKKSFPEYSVEPVSLLPWALSIKIFGLPIFRAVLSSDLVLITDNILFDKELYNPLYNYLSTLALVLPLAGRRGIPIIMYNMSLGPITTSAGKWCLERIVRSSQLIILRDIQSKDLLERLKIPHDRIEIGADCALNTRICSPERLGAIIDDEGLFRNNRDTIGFNVNTYLDTYLKPGGGTTDREYFTNMIAQTVDRIIEQLGVDVLFFVTQVMDLKITKRTIDKIRYKEQVKVVSNEKYNYEELTTIMQRLQLMVGLRTHALILASSINTPIVGLISYPKTSGYLASIGQDKWAIKFEELDESYLFSMITKAYQQRSDIRSHLKIAVQREKQKARQSALLLGPFLDNSSVAQEFQFSQG